LNIIITGNQDVSDIIKNHISSQIVKLAKYAKKIESASVIITEAKKGFLTVIVIWADGVSFTRRATTTGDIYTSIGSAFTKIESQFKKHKKRRNSKFRRQMNKRKFKFQNGIKQLQKELVTNIKPKRRFKKIQNMVYAAVITMEPYINDHGIEFIGIV
jgi:ribosomal subunit interface protein